ncbi:Dehydrogenase/reductase SDR family member on chromosome X [Seminavis robusta]|uniref:Dehydrogenase/reductase SDR family member on chromosome X n=1 Tax=Seminavis robusta TaxID=568900 RepID=A0A9N8E363_9STRA|nr:Dehydrogenase/reductase SDR family member on chromosome X [Seminavis robusta]|eukprot:Sro609_g175050.1 Dehydrogenase/reductase SDR family member on chromosome X (462) ;mRNA; f:32583-33968
MIHRFRVDTWIWAFFFVAFATAQEPSCPHGLSANDIAARSELDLTGNTALITGGRSGLGYAIAEALVQQNCTVVIASRSVPENQQAVAKLQALGGDVSYAIFDLEDFSSVEAFAAELTANHSRLDYYFGNAGQGGSGAQPLTVDGYERIFQVNYAAQFLLIERLLPLLRASGEPARILLTGSSSNSLACGSLGMAAGNFQPDVCFDSNSTSGNAMSVLPFDQTGLDAVNSTFDCPPLAGTYPLTKFLMIQLAKEVSRREAEAGNPVYAFSWAPGNIQTDLNPWAACCVGPVEWFGPTCRYQLPYVGPTDDLGNPNPPDPPVPNHWSSPAHGTMSALHAALHAPVTEAGNFYAAYWECEANKGFFPQGMTEQGRMELYEKSLEWVGITQAEEQQLAAPDMMDIEDGAEEVEVGGGEATVAKQEENEDVDNKALESSSDGATGVPIGVSHYSLVLLLAVKLFY